MERIITTKAILIILLKKSMIAVSKGGLNTQIRGSFSMANVEL